MEVPKDKFILDACCGPKEMWYNRHHKNAFYIDIRKGEFSFEGRTLIIDPNEIMDFRNMGFKDKTFKLVVFDPPHLKNVAKTTIFPIKYGALDKETWGGDLKAGLSECWRVLDDYGILIFKWNEHDIKLKRIEPYFPAEPLFASKTHFNKNNKVRTLWFCFMKIPEYSQGHFINAGGAGACEPGYKPGDYSPAPLKNG